MDPDETTLEQLLRAIRRAAAAPSLAWARPPRRLSGGFWAQMWRIRLSDTSEGLEGELVARVMPNAEVAARETAVQAHLADHGYPTPHVRLAAGPGPDLDRAWMLMDLAPGKPLLAGLSGLSALIRLPRLARSLPDRLARHAATLHRIDPGPLRDQDLSATARLRRLHDQATGIGRDDLAASAEWLEANRPDFGGSVICHGDLHPFNILTDPGGDTVLDWSATQITDPAYDVAFTRLLLGHPPLGAPRPLEPVIAFAGRALAARFTRTYDDLAPRPVDEERLDWFTELHALRMLTEVAVWYAQDEVDLHRGHPFLTLQKPLTALLHHPGSGGARTGREPSGS